MLLQTIFSCFLCVTGALLKRSETIEDAAQVARTLLANSSVGSMATSYPRDHTTLAGMPFSLQEYYASCYNNGSLLLLFLPISRHSRNILNSPLRAASISVWSSPHPSAALPRVALTGYVTVFDEDTLVHQNLRECYLKVHPDARQWLPDEPDSPHISLWARFDPVNVYFVGGFGDEHFIGDVPLLLYQEARPYGLSASVTGQLRIQDTVD